MKDLWLLIIGDMPVWLQWAGAIVGLVVAVFVLTVGNLGDLPRKPVKHGFTEEAFTMPGADALRVVDHFMGLAANVVAWLVLGPLAGYLAVVLVYITWPWCGVAVVAVVVLVKTIEWLWQRRGRRT